jgi:hypothetical protein
MDVTSCVYCKNRRFRGVYRLHPQGDKNQRAGTTFAVTVPQLLRSAEVSSSPILVTLMTETILFFESSDPTRATRRHNPEDNILYCYNREKCARIQRFSILKGDLL